jgi:hypothetical protein
MCKCNNSTTPKPCNSTACKYLGADIDCLGVLSKEPLDSVVQKIADKLCNITTPETNQIASYTETALGSGHNISTEWGNISGTSYTVNSGYEGTYELMYVVNITNNVVSTIKADFNLFKNDVEYSAITKKSVSIPTNSTSEITVFISNIDLVQGDSISIKSKKDIMGTAYTLNGVFKLTKIS